MLKKQLAISALNPDGLSAVVLPWPLVGFGQYGLDNNCVKLTEFGIGLALRPDIKSVVLKMTS